MKMLMTALAIATVATACTPNPHQTQMNDISGQTFGLNGITTPHIHVASMDGKPLAQAQILIGDSLNAPFVGNFITTDNNGMAMLPAAWDSALPVTVEAPGYMRVTYMNQEPGQLNFKLRPMATRTQYELRGTTPSLPIKDKDGWVDFGIVMPAFTKLGMLNFGIDSVLSPLTDRITQMGQDMDIPANIALPKQSEKFALFTITLDKPLYRIYYEQPGVNRVFAARGRFPFKSTVDGLRGGAAFHDLLNNYTITSGSVRDFNTQSAVTNLDMNTTELVFNEKRNMGAPTFRADEVFITVSVANQSGHFIIADFKRLKSTEKVALSVLPKSDQQLLGVLKKSDDMKNNISRVSTTLVPFANNATPVMLPLIADPQFSGADILVPRLNPVQGIHALATYAVLSKEEDVTRGKDRLKVFNPQWEVYSQNWNDRLKVPQWPTDSKTSGKKRWEINLVGSQSTSQAATGPAMIEAATHVTNSSITF